jgi:hypothetical protein
MVLIRVAEPENLKTVPVPTFDLITVPAPVPGHIHAYTFTNTYMVHLCVHFRKRIRIHILMYTHTYVLHHLLYSTSTWCEYKQMRIVL